jgi:hypothetical protein
MYFCLYISVVLKLEVGERMALFLWSDYRIWMKNSAPKFGFLINYCIIVIERTHGRQIPEFL